MINIENLYARAQSRSSETGLWENGWIGEVEDIAWETALSQQQQENDLIVAAGGEEMVVFQDFADAKKDLEDLVRLHDGHVRLPYRIEKDYCLITNESPVLRMRYQPTGDCVGCGTSRAIEALLLEMWDQHLELKPRPIHPSFLYGGARMLGRATTGAGASVAHAAQFINTYGVLFEDDNFIKDYDSDRNMSQRFGQNWNGELFKKCLQKAAGYYVSVIRLPNRNNMDAINLALDAGGKIIGGLRRKFVHSEAHREGVKFARILGTWNHCVSCVGRFREPVAGYAWTNSHGNRYNSNCVLSTPAWATNITPSDMEDVCDNASLYAVIAMVKKDNHSKPDWRIV
jgi:hypothetical protein